ncbi:PfkB family carbohydrate kinase [Dictyobacter aurantiacus]|uniref:Bifunctional protein HldE n=1 Tax=Dictyobacter aurantiacus TaxID=1936993 RepID=A0A401Z7D6_9CHLR|nr:PfkB family carbohydrate kinase [Dictyobacter aurantiacus]GCE02749.1 bifunctional protein HldE [Dictyobacter aurantiacus]
MHKDVIFTQQKVPTTDILHTAIETVERFSKLRILVLGDAMLDSYLEGTASRLCSEGPVPVVAKTSEQHLAGGAANTAMNIRALGAHVDLLGIIGDDGTAKLLRTTLQHHQINDQWLLADPERQTLHKVRILANNQYVVRFDEGYLPDQTGDSQAQLTSQLLAHLETLYHLCDAVIISDYCYGTVTEEVIARLQMLHERDPRPLLVDSKALWRFRTLPMTVATPNLGEAQHLLATIRSGGSGQIKAQVDPRDTAQVSSLAQQLLEMFAAHSIVITLGSDGALLLHADHPQQALHVPAHSVPHANDVGAGDSFASTLITALAAGADIQDAVYLSRDAASIAVTKSYTATVSQQELLQHVHLRLNLPLRDTSIHALPYIMKQLEHKRGSGNRIVLTNGVFDILHRGHIQLLHQARQLGDILVVAINSDRSTRHLKGPTRPINGEEDRLTLVAALDMVDYAFIFDEDTPERCIRLLRPDIHVKGGNYMGKTLPEETVLQDIGGQLVILPFVPSHSTSHVIERIVAIASASKHDGYT